ncbi:DUF3106 domain-containing protein [Massilia sp. DWR3-1-1]|uniref:DUF3106 domain-containing protein n=1 Tax=Massilia sp. DWR3-1-1 TaxID=2804559 RepID=UPI003CF06561
MASTSILPSAVNKVGRLACMAALIALACAGTVAAQSPAPQAAAPAVAPLVKPAWVNLSPAQKLALEPLAGEWDRLEPLRKQKWLDIANRFAAMKPDEQARVHEKMREWVRMSPDERRLVRENYTKAKKLDVTQKSEQWEKYQQLPEEQKQKLAAEAAKSKKQLTNLPPPAQANLKTVAPIRRNAPPASTTTAPAPAVPAPAPAPAPANVK